MKFLIFLTIAVAPFIAAHRSSLRTPWNDESLELEEQLSNATISLKHFRIFDKLGYGGFAKVYAAKKIGGADDGKLYALKAIQIPNSNVFNQYYQLYINELEVLKAIRGIPFSTGLHYAFREGDWLFLVMDLVTGGELSSKIGTIDATAAKLILAELIVAVEGIHKANVLHLDLSAPNVLIDSDGDLVVIDFGFSKWRSQNIDMVRLDWEYIPRLFRHIFRSAIDDQHLSDVLNILTNNMTDEQVPELKNHPYFDGINWDGVAARTFKAPFPPTKTKLNLQGPMNRRELFKTNIDDKFAAQIAEKFSKNYSYVAPEHQNQIPPNIIRSRL